jgi:hypothetical protein
MAIMWHVPAYGRQLMVVKRRNRPYSSQKSFLLLLEFLGICARLRACVTLYTEYNTGIACCDRGVELNQGACAAEDTS